MPSAERGPDSLIPPSIIDNAKGLVLMTVFKAGFLVSIRGGSGIVIAKRDDGHWSAPAAIAVAGLGGGFEIGAELTDFVIVLNSQSAVEAFSKGGNLTLGGNFSVAIGPVGRNAEADVAVRSPSAIYTYSKTRGLFAGISLEGSGIVERKDANKKFYGDDVRTRELLSGSYAPPDEAAPLYKALEQHKTINIVVDKATKAFDKRAKSFTGGASVSSFTKSRQSMMDRANKHSTTTTSSKSGRSTFDSPARSSSTRGPSSRTTSTSTSKVSSSTSASRASSSTASSRRRSSARSRDEDEADPAGADWDAEVYVRALYTFRGQMDCDLTFKKGEKIELVTRTSSQFDWWEGKTSDGRLGIFPANYVKLV